MERHVLTLDEATCRRRTSIKWRHHEEDVLPLWVAEMDVLPAQAVSEELARIASDGDLGYPVPTPYLEAVARWYESVGAAVDPARMRLVTDVMSGVRAAITALTEPGDPVYITVPVYPPFHAAVAATGRRLQQVPLSPDGRLDVPGLERAFAQSPGSGAVLLSNPHNPTGTVPTRDELADLGRAATAHGVGIVSDEVHAPLVLPGAHFTPISSVPETAGALTVMSPAKGWNLAGLKAAAVIGGQDAAGPLSRISTDLSHTVGHVAIRAHTAALDHGRDWLADLVADLDANRTLLDDLLAQHLPSVGWQPVEATYLAWLDVRELGWGDDPARHLLDQGRVALTPGPPFGEGGGHARLNFAASPGVLREAVERMAAVEAPDIPGSRR